MGPFMQAVLDMAVEALDMAVHRGGLDNPVGCPGAGRYRHLEAAVRAYFRRSGCLVTIEPHGSRGPDIEGPGIVGEIKSRREVERDLRGYWSAWNSSARFGGKRCDFRLRDVLPEDVDMLPGAVRGWIATIYGQLRNYVHRAGLTEGWLVVEDGAGCAHDLRAAVRYLERHGLAHASALDYYQGLAFVEIAYR